MSEVIGVISIKGGVGKTTVSANLGFAFAKLNKKTLLIKFLKRFPQAKG